MAQEAHTRSAKHPVTVVGEGKANAAATKSATVMKKHTAPQQQQQHQQPGKPEPNVNVQKTVAPPSPSVAPASVAVTSVPAAASVPDVKPSRTPGMSSPIPRNSNSARDPLAGAPPPRPTINSNRRMEDESFARFIYRRMNSGDSTPSLAGLRRGLGGYNYRQNASYSCVHRSFRLDGPEGELFATRHQQLNLDPDALSRAAVANDLHLEESTTTNNEDEDDTAAMAAAAMTFPSRTSSNIMRTQQHSSLFYNYNGRLLLRLPSDRVRLVTDDDLPSGILAVEQCRREGSLEMKHNNKKPATDASDAEAQTARLNNNNNNNNNDHGVIGDNNNFWKSEPQHEQPLRYVQVVPNDLYRRVVSEISESRTDNYCGLFTICDESAGHVDISVALFILGVVFSFLFIFTMVWPTS